MFLAPYGQNNTTLEQNYLIAKKLFTMDCWFSRGCFVIGALFFNDTYFSVNYFVHQKKLGGKFNIFISRNITPSLIQFFLQKPRATHGNNAVHCRVEPSTKKCIGQICSFFTLILLCHLTSHSQSQCYCISSP